MNRVGLVHSVKTVLTQHCRIVREENMRSRIGCLRYYSSQTSIPDQAQVVISGYGIVSLSTAYNLIKRGISDVIILKRGHVKPLMVSADYASPLFRLKPFQEEAVLRESFSLYQSLQDKGFDIGMENTGGLYLAQNNETLIRLKRRRDVLIHTSNLSIELLGPREIKDKYPFINTEGLEGGVLVHDDVAANAHKIMDALSTLSVEGGAKVISKCPVEKVVVESGKVVGVQTTKGIIKCQYFVNATGCYSWEIGQRQNPPVRIPLHSILRHYLKTKPIVQSDKENPASKFPSISDFDSNMYFSQLSCKSIVIGAFEKNAKPIFTDGIPEDVDECMKPCWDHFAPIIDAAINRFPSLKDFEIDKFTCERESFSPDSFWIIGEAAEIRNYFVGAATCGNPMEVGGGMGIYLAHWISEGKRPAPLLKFDILRFNAVQNCRTFLRDRVPEAVAAQHSGLIPHLHCFKTARQSRCSPFYATLNERGAVNGEDGGFERPLYFDTTKPNTYGDITPPLTYFKPSFFNSVKREHSACLHGVGVLDASAYAKFFISSSQDQVVGFLQKMCATNVDIPIGHVCATGMHNDQGGFEVDCILCRLASNRYFMLCPAVLQNRAPVWIRRFLPSDNSVQLIDETSSYAILMLIGPKSCQLLSEIARSDMTMPGYRILEKDLAYAPGVNVITFTNTAEPGYLLCIPTEYAHSVYNKIMRIGKDYGACNVGHFAHRILRMEKQIGNWGDDIHDGSTPAEVGRTSRIDFTKEFMGKEAMLKQQKEGVRQKLTLFTFGDEHNGYSVETDPWPCGGEPIFRNGVFIGQTTSISYAFRRKLVLLHTYVTKPDREKNGKLGIVTKEYIVDKNAIYHMNVAGKKCKIFPEITLRSEVQTS